MTENSKDNSAAQSSSPSKSGSKRRKGTQDVSSSPSKRQNSETSYTTQVFANSHDKREVFMTSGPNREPEKVHKDHAIQSMKNFERQYHLGGVNKEMTWTDEDEYEFEEEDTSKSGSRSKQESADKGKKRSQN